ncbi:MAG: hypothetical protein C0618_08930 [Desulfuromonas sp.]|nr:MAG: hypothetical protein C0618_08930 [Desulfuromonas sp.]
MKIKVRYQNGRLQMVSQEERTEKYDDPEFLEFYQANWSAFGVDPIRSMIRGGYKVTAGSKQSRS